MKHPPSAKIAEAQRLLGEAQREISSAVKDNRSSERGTLNAELWKISKMQMLFPQYYSVAGQDMFLDQYLFDTRRGGTFVDVGAYDGVTGSNTLFFEMFRGWDGLLIEPVPQHLERASSWRNATTLGSAVGASEDVAEFMIIEEGYTQMSGFLDCYREETLERVRSHPDHREKVAPIVRRPLGHLLDQAGISKVDLLSIDVRGDAFDILEGFDFSAFHVQAALVDNPGHDRALHDLLKSRGFKLLEFLGTDEIYGRVQ